MPTKDIFIFNVLAHLAN